VTLLAFIYFGLAVLGLATTVALAKPLPYARIVAVTLLPALAFAIWLGARPPTGWPTHAQTPRDTEFLWASIREPDQLTHDRGEIDLWLIAPDATSPRAYRKPYSRKLHERAEQAVKHGRRVGVRNPTASGHETTEAAARFYLLPPAVPSRKDQGR
jgi:hypothetical protein